MTSSESVKLFLAADRTIFRHIPAVINSAQKVTSRPIQIGIATHGVEAAHHAALRGKFPSTEIQFFDVADQDLAGLRTKLDISPMSFARLLMPSLVDWERFIYLDIDVLVLRDLSVLYDTPLGESPAAGVKYRRGGQFNAGVLLVDASAWRSRGLGQRMLEYARIHKPKNADQTALNEVIGSEMASLDPRWNARVDAIWGGPVRDPQKRLQDAWILHFITGFKPWNLGRRYIAPPFVEAYDAHTDTRELPRNLRAEMRLLGWQMVILWKMRRRRAEVRSAQVR